MVLSHGFSIGHGKEVSVLRFSVGVANLWRGKRVAELFRAIILEANDATVTLVNGIAFPGTPLRPAGGSCRPASGHPHDHVPCNWSSPIALSLLSKVGRSASASRTEMYRRRGLPLVTSRCLFFFHLLMLTHYAAT